MSPAVNFLFDVENDIRSADDMARAVFLLLESGEPPTKDDVSAILRCVCHLQEHVDAVMEKWAAALDAERGIARIAA